MSLSQKKNVLTSSLIGENLTLCYRDDCLSRFLTSWHQISSLLSPDSLKTKFHYASYLGAGSEQAPNQLRASSELAPNRFGASSEPARVMEFGFYFYTLV